MATIKVLLEGVVVTEINDAKSVTVANEDSITSIRYVKKGTRTDRQVTTNLPFVIEGEVSE